MNKEKLLQNKWFLGGFLSLSTWIFAIISGFISLNINPFGLLGMVAGGLTLGTYYTQKTKTEMSRKLKWHSSFIATLLDIVIVLLYLGAIFLSIRDTPVSFPSGDIIVLLLSILTIVATTPLRYWSIKKGCKIQIKNINKAK